LDIQVKSRFWLYLRCLSTDLGDLNGIWFRMTAGTSLWRPTFTNSHPLPLILDSQCQITFLVLSLSFINGVRRSQRHSIQVDDSHKSRAAGVSTSRSLTFILEIQCQTTFLIYVGYLLTDLWYLNGIWTSSMARKSLWRSGIVCINMLMDRKPNIGIGSKNLRLNPNVEDVRVQR
jgi:hypothetical protein